MTMYYLECKRTKLIFIFDTARDAFDFSDSYITPQSLVAISLFW